MNCYQIVIANLLSCVHLSIHFFSASVGNLLVSFTSLGKLEFSLFTMLLARQFTCLIHLVGQVAIQFVYISEQFTCLICLIWQIRIQKTIDCGCTLQLNWLVLMGQLHGETYEGTLSSPQSLT